MYFSKHGPLKKVVFVVSTDVALYKGSLSDHGLSFVWSCSGEKWNSLQEQALRTAGHHGWGGDPQGKVSCFAARATNRGHVVLLRRDASDMGNSKAPCIFYQFCCQHITVMSGTKKTCACLSAERHWEKFTSVMILVIFTFKLLTYSFFSYIL